MSVTRSCKGATYLVLAVDVVSAIDTTGRARTSAVVTPAGSALPIRTIPRHVAGIATDTTDDASRIVLLLRAVVLAVTDLAAVLASLVLIVTKGTVEGSELTQLVAFELVLALGNGGSLRRRENERP